MSMRLFLAALTVAFSCAAAMIESGTISSSRGGAGVVDRFNIDLTGTTAAGNPFVIDLGSRSLPMTGPAIGNDICGGGLCTWDFGQYSVTIPLQYSFMDPQSIIWDGTSYAFGPGSIYTATLVFDIAATPKSVPATTIQRLTYWTFPKDSATMSISLTILQGSTVLVSDTMNGNFVYSGSAFQSYIGMDWHTDVTYNAVPEPGTLVQLGIGAALVAVSQRWRLQRRWRHSAYFRLS